MPDCRRLLTALSIAFLCVALGTASASAHDSDSDSDSNGAGAQGLYPTDRCVSGKLSAVADYCQTALRAWAGHDRERDGKRDRRLARAEARLATKWARAEALSAAAGVDCSQASATSAELAASVGEAVRLLAGAIAGGADVRDHEHRGGRCEDRGIKAAARACRDLLDAQAAHLAARGADRLRVALTDDSRAALDRLRDHFESDGDHDRCSEGAGLAAVEAQLLRTVDEAVAAASVTRAVAGEWTRIDPESGVAYAGRVLDPICSAGTPYAFWVRRGTVNKLLVYYQGGGACWNQITCGGVPEFGISPTFDQAVTDRDDPSRATTGFADLDNPENPFRDWNAVFVPYCTGDVHWGDATVEHTLATNRSTTIHHRGFINAQTVEKWAREHFVYPQQVFVTGSSAGAYGAIVNSLTLQENVYPSSDVAVLGDAGNGVITDEFLRNDLVKWGLEKNLPDFIPALDVPIEQLSAADLWAESAKHFPENRFATYTTAYDGSTGGQTGFFHIMTHANILEWRSWWRSACTWNGLMRDLNQTAAAAASNFRFYVGSGSRHTMWGSDKVYSDTTGGVPTIVSWVNAMLDDSPAWVSAECSDCSTLLPGDPRPSPPQPPFTEDGRIVCP